MPFIWVAGTTNSHLLAHSPDTQNTEELKSESGHSKTAVGRSDNDDNDADARKWNVNKVVTGIKYRGVREIFWSCNMKIQDWQLIQGGEQEGKHTN